MAVENFSFWIWLAAVLLIVGIGLGSMVRAYWGKESVVVIFPDPIATDPVPTLQPEAASRFQQACTAYRNGQYRQAIDQFTQAIQHDPDLAEAYHNRGRAIVNLRRIPEGIADLVKAGEIYSQQNNGAELTQLKQDLSVLKGQKDKATQG